jgi:hypothetical protein
MAFAVAEIPTPCSSIATNGCFEGNYRDYSKDFHKRKGVDADRPHRIAYKKLVRA